MDTSSSANTPAGANHSLQLGDERGERNQIAQSEATDRGVDRPVGHREVEQVTLDEQSVGASGGQNAVRQVHSDRSVSALSQVNAEVSGS